jgi:hypothetical protein
MRRILSIAIVVASLGVAASPASARVVSDRTQVTVNFAGIGIGVFAEGQVISPRPVCEGGRKVLIIAITPNGNQLVETDRTSDNGFYGGGGTPRGADRPTGVKVKAPRTTFKRHGQRHVCKGGAYAVHIPGG